MKMPMQIAVYSILTGALLSQLLTRSSAAQISPETTHLINSLDGAELYKAYCAVCHANNGHGGGPMAAALRTTPSDLTKIAGRNGGVYPAASVEKIIMGEQQVPGGHGTQTMPIWGPIFSQITWDQDLGRIRTHNLAAYIAKMQGH
jgi:mono/diheme cytochrome c family protein